MTDFKHIKGKTWHQSTISAIIIVDLHLTNLNNFDSLDAVVNRVSETQLQVSENAK